MLEYPPILNGSPQQQLRDLRDYLVRRIREQEKETERQTAPSAAAGTDKESAALRSRIGKTADTLQDRLQKLTDSLHGDYLPRREFWDSREQEWDTLLALAALALEGSGLPENLETAAQRLDRLEQQLTDLDRQLSAAQTPTEATDSGPEKLGDWLLSGEDGFGLRYVGA